jgi:hypothetical protein
MLKLKQFLESRTGVILISIVLGLGLSSIFKMSCDSRSCLIFQAPDFSEKKVMRYNGKCYEPVEHMEKCDGNKKVIDAYQAA